MFPTSDIAARLHWLVGEAVRWAPELAVGLVFAVAVVEAVVLPRRLWPKGILAFVVVLCGVGAGGLLLWDARVNRENAARDAAAEVSALRGLWAQWDTLSHTLPPAASEPPANFDTAADALASLSAKVASIGGRVAALKAGAIARSIDPATAVKLADYLHRYGAYRVVVSCAPSDVEAFSYATQLVGILKTAGWDANGPEPAADVPSQPAMGVMVLIRDPSAPDAAKILLDAFNQMNIPHQPGISADDAIPDTATVELYVPRKP